jgi:hypothetical protein
LLCLTDTSLYIYISRELLATLEEEYLVELVNWLVGWFIVLYDAYCTCLTEKNSSFKHAA